MSLIVKAIRTPTISIPSSNGYEPNEKGVPQGLSISNILANIFLSNLDNKFAELLTCGYVRYVDDILILCKKVDYSKIMDNIVYELDHYLKLKVSSEVEKTIHGEIAEGFTFLGYTKNAEGFTVRESSVNKFKDSLSQLFTQFKYSKNRNLEILLWKVNLKVTGCINEGRKYGWLFFFSQINDTKLLFELDWLVKKYFINAGFKKEYCTLKIKKFVKAHKEITLNLSGTSYIPIFDSFTFDEKKKLLINIFKQDISGMKTEQIDWLFKKMIYISIKDLEKDIQPIS
nr:reverse transcriptase domain-containing protein [Desulfosporosinus sp. I2]